MVRSPTRARTRPDRSGGKPLGDPEGAVAATPELPLSRRQAVWVPSPAKASAQATHAASRRAEADDMRAEILRRHPSVTPARRKSPRHLRGLDGARGAEPAGRT